MEIATAIPGTDFELELNGQTLPSTKTLLRYAEATGSQVRVRLWAA